MKSRIQEALRRRHRRGDEGFTLIELLVVILIIAILAAVGIVALLSALNSGKKSAAKTTLRNAITSVKSAQTGAGQTDYTGIIGNGAAAANIIVMQTEDPDLTWQNATALGNGANTNVVSLFRVATNETIIMATRAQNGVCYYAELNSNAASRYGSVNVGAANACAAPAAAGPGAASATSTGWQANTTLGWNK